MSTSDVQRAVHRALVGDFQKLRPLLGAQLALEGDGAIDVVDLALARFTFGAILGVNLLVAQPDLGAQKRNLLEIRIEPYCHRGAGAERGEEKIIGPRPGIEAAVLDRLIGKEPVRAENDFLLKFTAPRLAHLDDTRRCVVGRLIVGRHVEITRSPGGDHARHIGIVAPAAEQMIGAGKRDEALRMLRCEEDVTRIIDPDSVVGRGMEDQQRLVQLGDERCERLLGDVVEKGAADFELPPRQRDLYLAVHGDVGDLTLEQASNVGGIGRCADGDDGTRLGNAVGGGEHRCAPETVADQNRRRREFLPQVIGGGDQIVDVRRECRIGELTFAGAEPGEIEAQHGDAVKGQTFGNAPRRAIILAAGEAMGEQRHGADRTLRPVEQRGELVALLVAKIELLGGHEDLLRSREDTPISWIRSSAPS